MKKTRKESKRVKFWEGPFKTFEEFMDDCLRRSRERMAKEMGYGIPEPEQLNLFDDKEE